MPKIIELTVEVDVQKVSCPGVWLCQDGRVSLSVSAFGTNYQTCLLPPVFPLMFKDIFYFKKRFQETCAMNNMCCLLKDETMYCELIQWNEDFKSGEYVTLAQYLGSVTDILFPPNMCFNDGVDLLMRRTKNFPGILSPKIEIATKVRIDEINQPSSIYNSAVKTNSCQCSVKECDSSRQKQVCHSAQYHRSKCLQKKSPGEGAREPILRSDYRDYSPKGRSSLTERPVAQKSCCKVTKESKERVSCECANPVFEKVKVPNKFRPLSPSKHRNSAPPCSPRCNFNVYTAEVPQMWHEPSVKECNSEGVERDDDDVQRLLTPMRISADNVKSRDDLQRITLESSYVNECDHQEKKMSQKYFTNKVTPCVCDICRKYHELFHTSKYEYTS